MKRSRLDRAWSIGTESRGAAVRDLLRDADQAACFDGQPSATRRAFAYSRISSRTALGSSFKLCCVSGPSIRSVTALIDPALSILRLIASAPPGEPLAFFPDLG